MTLLHDLVQAGWMLGAGSEQGAGRHMKAAGAAPKIDQSGAFYSGGHLLQQAKLCAHLKQSSPK